MRRPDLPKTPNNTDYALYYYPEVQIKNGYMCLTVHYPVNSNLYYYDTEVAYFDLYTGEELSLSDLFYEGVDVDGVINGILENTELNIHIEGDYYEQILLKDFTKLGSNDSFTLTFDSIYFNHDNTLMEECMEYRIELDDKVFIVNEPRDMADLFENNVKVTRNFALSYEYVLEKQPDGITSFAPLPEEGENKEKNKRLNDIIRNYIKETVTEDLVNDLLAKNEYLKNVTDLQLRFATTIYKNKAIVLHGIYFNGYEEYPVETLVIDIQNEVIADYTLFLKDGWEETVNVKNQWSLAGFSDEAKEHINNNEIPPDAIFISLAISDQFAGNVQKKTALILSMRVPDDYSYCQVIIDPEYVDWD